MVALGLAIQVSSRKRHLATTYFMMMMVSAGLWSFFSGVHLIVSSFTWKLIWSDFKFLFITTLPVFWVLLASAFSGIKAPTDRKRMALLFAIPAITVLLIATNQFHLQVFRNAAPLETERFTSISRDYGPWFWIHTTYSYTLIVSGVAIFVRSIFRNRGALRIQACIMALGSLVPFGFNAIYLSNPDAFFHLDFTPVAFAATGVVYWVGLFRYRLLDLVPVAREVVFKTIGDGVCVVDSNDVIADINDVALELGDLGSRAKGSPVGRPLLDIFPFLRKSWEAQDRNRDYREEVTIPLHGSPVWHAVKVKKLVDPKRLLDGHVIVITNIDDRKKAEVELQQAKDKAEELSTLKSAFLRNMSHDVRTPLTGIIGLSQVLGSELQDEQKELVDMIHESGSKLLKLINSLLSVAHLSSGSLDSNEETVNLIDLSRTVLAPVEKEISQSEVDLKVSLPDHILEAFCDRNHLSHALIHTLDHTVRYTKSGSIQFDLRQEMGEAVFRIVDTGEGFEEQFIQSIHAPLDSKALADFGLNTIPSLGLRVANGLIEEMGGMFAIRSEKGQGSTYTISLPMKQPISNTDREPVKNAADRLDVSRQARAAQ